MNHCARLVAFSLCFLPLPRQADEWLFMAPLTKAKELVNNFLCLEEQLLCAGFQLLVAMLKIGIHCPQVHNGRCVEEIVHGQPFHKELEFICKNGKIQQVLSYSSMILCVTRLY